MIKVAFLETSRFAQALVAAPIVGIAKSSGTFAVGPTENYRGCAKLGRRVDEVGGVVEIRNTRIGEALQP